MDERERSQGQGEGEGEDPGEVEADTAPVRVGRHRAGLVATAILVAIVLVSLPFAVRSMAVELLGRQQDTLYDLATNQPVPPAVGALDGPHRSYFNIAVVSVDETTGTATLALSGNRECPAACPTAVVTLYSLDDNAAQRRGLPPSAALTLQPADLVFSQSLQLPVRGRPSLYPFDTYDLWLGFAVEVTPPGGGTVPIDREAMAGQAVFTLQNQASDLVMAPPRWIEPDRVVAATDRDILPLVEALSFGRPLYLKVLSVLLVLLISVSGGIALMTRSIDDLLLGVGGLILGVWGIRSVLINQPLPGVSAVDLALSLVILFLLLGLAIRLALHFHRRSNLNLRLRRPESAG
jgi:hypothetical protein